MSNIHALLERVTIEMRKRSARARQVPVRALTFWAEAALSRVYQKRRLVKT